MKRQILTLLKLKSKRIWISNFFPPDWNAAARREIIDNFARCRKEEAVNKMMSARLNENRSFLFSQMETTEDIISSISENLKFSYSKTMTREPVRRTG